MGLYFVHLIVNDVDFSLLAHHMDSRIPNPEFLIFQSTRMSLVAFLVKMIGLNISQNSKFGIGEFVKRCNEQLIGFD